MNKTTTEKNQEHYKHPDLDTAIDTFLKQGGKINPATTKNPMQDGCDIRTHPTLETDNKEEQTKKIELLKSLITKGAGMSALQYSLKMNKGDIKRIAQENGLRILHTRPLCTTRKYRPLASSSSAPTDDVIAGHAMHYAALGYTAVEIAQTLELTIRQVWELGKNYRFELRQYRDD